MAPLRFYFDFVSPYAYIAWTQIGTMAARHDRALEPVATLFAGLLGANGQLGPAEIPRKRAYIFKDVVRTARVLGIELRPPSAHPFNPLLGLRASSVDLAPDVRIRVIDCLFRAVWAGGPGITDAAVVAELLTAAGVDGEALVERAGSDEIKQRVRAQTDAALAEGVFGVPTVIADGELFWGYDAFGHLERRLSGADPLDGIDVTAWLDLPAQSVRRR